MIKKTFLKGNGDFRSDECIALLKEADIVVTNPPFSLFREYISTLVEHKKKFIVIGNKNAIAYKETFKLIKENKLWLGHYELVNFKLPNSEISRVPAFWFTNLNIKKRHEDIILYKEYKKSKTNYPKYDNYNAINVDKVKDIPMDYKGAMGVPITFMNKYNPDQFEIIDINPHFFAIVEQGLPKPKQLKISGRKDPYARVLIKRK